MECKDEEQQKKAVKVNALNELKVKGMKAHGRIRGVITGIPVKESMEGMSANIKNVKVSEAKIKNKKGWSGM